MCKVAGERGSWDFNSAVYRVCLGWMQDACRFVMPNCSGTPVYVVAGLAGEGEGCGAGVVTEKLHACIAQLAVRRMGAPHSLTAPGQ